jgi:hypothetical protein
MKKSKLTEAQQILDMHTKEAVYKWLSDSMHLNARDTLEEIHKILQLTKYPKALEQKFDTVKKWSQKLLNKISLLNINPEVQEEFNSILDKLVNAVEQQNTTQSINSIHDFIHELHANLSTKK